MRENKLLKPLFKNKPTECNFVIVTTTTTEINKSSVLYRNEVFCLLLRNSIFYFVYNTFKLEYLLRYYFKKWCHGIQLCVCEFFNDLFIDVLMLK